jgi:hypothetical protein
MKYLKREGNYKYWYQYKKPEYQYSKFDKIGFWDTGKGEKRVPFNWDATVISSLVTSVICAKRVVEKSNKIQ